MIKIRWIWVVSIDEWVQLDADPNKHLEPVVLWIQQASLRKV